MCFWSRSALSMTERDGKPAKTNRIGKALWFSSCHLVLQGLALIWDDEHSTRMDSSRWKKFYLLVHDRIYQLWLYYVLPKAIVTVRLYFTQHGRKIEQRLRYTLAHIRFSLHAAVDIAPTMYIGKPYVRSWFQKNLCSIFKECMCKYDM